jgi:hypothetical protein
MSVVVTTQVFMPAKQFKTDYCQGQLFMPVVEQSVALEVTYGGETARRTASTRSGGQCVNRPELEPIGSK